MKISDELREWADVHCGEECEEYLGLLADRIDREMVELPKDRDGEVIHVGDMVYRDDVGNLEVRGINLTRHAVTVECECPDGTACIVFPTGIIHIRTDSLEQIADDIELAEKWCDGEGEYGTGISSVEESTLHEWADRIRKLAEKEDGR